MARAVETFQRLADAIPTNPERLAKARADFPPLLLAQEAILFELEQAVRAGDAGRKLPALVERQLRQAHAFGGLDLPGLQGRVIVITAALAVAVKDLGDGTVSDALASQQWLKRELDRLRLVLDGHAAPDDKAEELARKLDALAGPLKSSGPSLTEKQLQAFGRGSARSLPAGGLVRHPGRGPRPGQRRTGGGSSARGRRARRRSEARGVPASPSARRGCDDEARREVELGRVGP